MRVLIEAASDEVVVSVTDTGPGIAADALPHLFDRYWRAPGSNSHGFGLGMYIARGIVEAHAGSIWAESRPGEGLRVSFTLPRSAEPSPA